MLAAVLLLVSCDSAAQSDEACKRFAVYKEARGQSIKAMRATLDVIHNRMAKSGKAACRVLREPHQYPYFKYGVKKIDFSFYSVYYRVSQMKPVLSEKYIYQNHKHHPWSRNSVKIDDIYFSE